MAPRRLAMFLTNPQGARLPAAAALHLSCVRGEVRDGRVATTLAGAGGGLSCGGCDVGTPDARSSQASVGRRPLLFSCPLLGRASVCPAGPWAQDVWVADGGGWGQGPGGGAQLEPGSGLAPSPSCPQQEAESNLRKAKQGYGQRCEDHSKARFLAAKAEEEQAGTGPGAAASKTLDKRRRLEEEAKNKVSADKEGALAAEARGAGPGCVSRGNASQPVLLPRFLRPAWRRPGGRGRAEASLGAALPPRRRRRPWPLTARVWPMPRRRSRSWRTPR